MSAPPGYSNLIFDDSFSGTSLDTNNWNTYITDDTAQGVPWHSNGSGGSGISKGGYDAEYFEPSQVSVNNGLSLSAVLGSKQRGYRWTSGVVSTYGKFEFTGGYVQIEAEMPGGNGTWPGLWMLPGPGAGSVGDNYEIDIFEGNYLGNRVNPNDNAAWHLIESSGTVGSVTNVGDDLASGYHIYGLEWIPGQSLTWYVDGIQVGQETSAQVSIPDEPMELIMDLQIADSRAGGWHTVYVKPSKRQDSKAPTPSPSVMNVAEVQVYQ